MQIGLIPRRPRLVFDHLGIKRGLVNVDQRLVRRNYRRKYLSELSSFRIEVMALLHSLLVHCFW